jgi:hypothetical protein
MNANIPKYMNIKDFCKYSGYTRYQFMRMADRAKLELKAIGQFRMVNVQEALAAFEALPDKYREVPANLNPGVSTYEDSEILNEQAEQMEAGE